jgi:hypothetical protein
MKETTFEVQTEIPLDEHWHFLIKDEKNTFTSIPENLRQAGEVSKVSCSNSSLVMKVSH